MPKHPDYLRPADRPDPRPTIQVEKLPNGSAIMTIVVPQWSLDNQSHALTHDQLKHLTGRELSVLMRGRRQQLTKE